MTLRKLLQAFRSFPAQHELTARIIEGRKEMVQQIGPDNAVDAFDTKTFGELAQGKRCNGQVLNGPVADGGDSIRPF